MWFSKEALSCITVAWGSQSFTKFNGSFGGTGHMCYWLMTYTLNCTVSLNWNEAFFPLYQTIIMNNLDILYVFIFVIVK